MISFRFLAVAALLASVSPLADGQDMQDSIVWFHPNQVVRVANLPALTASSSNSATVLATALEIAVHNEAVCCGKESALEDTMLSEPRSLKELSAKLQERHYVSAGVPAVLHAEYFPQSSVNVGLILDALLDQHALLMEWKSHFYVLYGAVFNETRFYSGARHYAIVKLLLLDPQFSDQRRETTFNRQTDELTKVQGLLTLAVTQP